MTDDDLWAFDANLAIGQTVRVTFTSSYRIYEARGTVAKLNDKSVKVALAADIRADTHLGRDQLLYEKGQKIRVPRYISMHKWTANNCVLPCEESLPQPIK